MRDETLQRGRESPVPHSQNLEWGLERGWGTSFTFPKLASSLTLF